MVFIILGSFANFIYVINANLEHENGTSKPGYYQEFTGIESLDVLISVYLLGMLTEFNVDTFQKGYDRQ